MHRFLFNTNNFFFSEIKIYKMLTPFAIKLDLEHFTSNTEHNAVVLAAQIMHDKIPPEDNV